MPSTMAPPAAADAAGYTGTRLPAHTIPVPVEQLREIARALRPLVFSGTPILPPMEAARMVSALGTVNALLGEAG